MEVVPPRAHATPQVEALIEEGNGAPLRGLEGFPLGDLLGDRIRDQLADGSPPLGREDLRLPDGLPIEADCQVLLGLHGAHTGPVGTWHTCSTWIACRESAPAAMGAARAPPPADPRTAPSSIIGAAELPFQVNILVCAETFPGLAAVHALAAVVGAARWTSDPPAG